MTGQQLIDFIRENKAEEATVMVYDDEFGIGFYPELPDCKYGRMIIEIATHKDEQNIELFKDAPPQKPE